MLLGNTGYLCLCHFDFLCCPPSLFSETGSGHCAGATDRQPPKQMSYALAWPFCYPTSLWLLPIHSKDGNCVMEVRLSMTHQAAMDRKREGSRWEKTEKGTLHWYSVYQSSIMKAKCWSSPWQSFPAAIAVTSSGNSELL